MMKDVLDIALLSAETKLKMAWGGYPRGPLIIFFSPTELCNFRCKMCTIGRPGTINRDDEMDTSRILSLLNELRQCGTKILGIWGGEPLIHRDLGTILDATRSLGMHTYIVTNGYLLDAARRKILLQTGVNTVSVSLDHTSPAGHDSLRGKEGAFDQIIENMRAIIAESAGKINIGINMLVHKENIDEVVKMAHLACQTGLNWLKFLPALAGPPFNDKCFEDPGIRFSSSEIARFERAMSEARKILSRGGLYTNSLPYLQGMVKHFKGHDLSKGCRAGYLIACISSRGDVTMCARETRILGNIKHASFQEVWHSDAFQKVRKNPSPEACRHCWASCYAEASFRLDLGFHLKNFKTSLAEIGFVGGKR
jgi:MoaA/NifB/PqqE/SkfB family radical SAM enzyme